MDHDAVIGDIECWLVFVRDFLFAVLWKAGCVNFFFFGPLAGSAQKQGDATTFVCGAFCTRSSPSLLLTAVQAKYVRLGKEDCCCGVSFLDALSEDCKAILFFFDLKKNKDSRNKAKRGKKKN